MAWAGLARQLAPARAVLVWVTVPPDVALARRRQRNLPRDRSAGQLGVPVSTADPVVKFVAASGAVEAVGEARRVANLIDTPADAAPEA